MLVATGSAPRRIPGIPVDSRRIFDCDGILNLERFPARLMVVRAGISGCEYASIFSNFGRPKVYLIDRMERILPDEDVDLGSDGNG